MWSDLYYVYFLRLFVKPGRLFEFKGDELFEFNLGYAGNKSDVEKNKTGSHNFCILAHIL